jgi:hypothetical protein
VNTNTTGMKLFMVAVHVAALIAGILGGQWVFDYFAY